MSNTLTIQPDLQTRESVMFAGGRVQFAVEYGEGVRYVKVEAKLKKQGGGYERGTVTLEEASHVFVSEKGYGTPRIGTYYPKTQRFFPADDADPSFVAAFHAVVDLVNGDRGRVLDTLGARISVESKCCLCGLDLTDPRSIEIGMGTKCAGKPTGSRILHSSVFANQEQLDLDQPAPAAPDADPAAEIDQPPRPAVQPDFTDEELRALLTAAEATRLQTGGTDALLAAASKIADYLHIRGKEAFAQREAEQERAAYEREMHEDDDPHALEREERRNQLHADLARDRS